MKHYLLERKTEEGDFECLTLFGAKTDDEKTLEEIKVKILEEFFKPMIEDGVKYYCCIGEYFPLEDAICKENTDPPEGEALDKLCTDNKLVAKIGIDVLCYIE